MGMHCYGQLRKPPVFKKGDFTSFQPVYGCLSVYGHNIKSPLSPPLSFPTVAISISGLIHKMRDVSGFHSAGHKYYYHFSKAIWKKAATTKHWSTIVVPDTRIRYSLGESYSIVIFITLYFHLYQ